MDLKKIKFKTGTAAIYVLALMLVGLGYWNYVSTESNNIQTVAETQTENSEDENLGDAQFVSSNDVTLETKSTQSTETSTEIVKTESTNKSNDYYEESKLQRDTMTHYLMTCTQLSVTVPEVRVLVHSRTMVLQ